MITHTINGHIADVLSCRSRLDQMVYWATVDTEPSADGRCLLKLTVYAETPERIQVRHQGKKETAYRCGTWDTPEGVTWLTMDADRVGRWGNGKFYPIFITATAYRRVRQFASRFGRYRGRVLDYIWWSLERTEVVHRQDGTFFWEPVLAERSLGVFTAQLLGKNLVITDFACDWEKSSPTWQRVLMAVRELQSPWNTYAPIWRGREAA